MHPHVYATQGTEFPVRTACVIEEDCEIKCVWLTIKAGIDDITSHPCPLSS